MSTVKMHPPVNIHEMSACGDLSFVLRLNTVPPQHVDFVYKVTIVGNHADNALQMHGPMANAEQLQSVIKQMDALAQFAHNASTKLKVLLDMKLQQETTHAHE